MDITKLQRAVVDALEDVKAQDIQVFNTTHLTSLFDRVIVCSATSNRQTRALANSVCEKVKGMGETVIATEGEDTGEWVLVDIGDIVIHIMQPAIRAYYHLEQIWGGKAVHMKLLPESTRPVIAAGEKFDPMAISTEEPVGRRAQSRAANRVSAPTGRSSRPARSTR
jgi:ribosome-associated protein